jgi:hypothetical protein
MKYIPDIIIANIIYFSNWIKSFFTNIDYLRILDLNGNIKKKYLPIIINNNFKKIEIKHINSQKKFISTNFDELSVNQNETNTLLIQFQINDGKNLSNIINDYVDNTKIIDILDINKIPYDNNSKIFITLFRCKPINKEINLNENSKLKIIDIKSL